MDGYGSRSFYSSGSRGSAVRRVGEGLPRDDPQANPSQEDVEFALHPASRFGRVFDIAGGDLKVREVGFYSLHGDMSDESLLTLRNDRSYLRAVTMKCSADGDTPVPNGPWDLDDGFSRKTTKERVKFLRGVAALLKWTRDNAEDPRVRELANGPVDFVSTNSTIGHLMKIIYQRDSRSDNGWMFAAARANNKIVISHITRSGLDGICQRTPPHAWRGQSNDHSAFWGRRFEVYMTQQDVGSGDDSNKVDAEGEEVGASRYRSVVLTKLRDLSLLLEAGVDGYDPLCQKAFPQKYVDMAIVPNEFLHRPDKFYLERMFRWWVSNVLADTGTLRVGFHSGGLVSKVRTYQVSNIPSLVQDKCRAGGMMPWEPNVCLGFLYQLLKYVQATVVKNHSSAVYEFSCAKDGPGFSSKEIPAEEASKSGHEYLTEDMDSFLT
ncbi:hypothetical protein RvY_03512 [Ramazzottius varieornatus]|uniref:Decapping nuclease n=1 Tax=Ramazzottius varieornatus TaxID=947166 RepID=A0A1D1URQ3_RAMVA|nr:hypothetical protein RvY_03512 [Ramazzottius varieornatus]